MNSSSNYVGGKWTTYRSMAEDTINAAIKTHNLKAGPSRTVGLFLQGGKDWSPTLYIRLVQDYGLESEVGVHRPTLYLRSPLPLTELATRRPPGFRISFCWVCFRLRNDGSELRKRAEKAVPIRVSILKSGVSLVCSPQTEPPTFFCLEPEEGGSSQVILRAE